MKPHTPFLHPLSFYSRKELVMTIESHTCVCFLFHLILCHMKPHTLPHHLSFYSQNESVMTIESLKTMDSLWYKRTNNKKGFQASNGPSSSLSGDNLLPWMHKWRAFAKSHACWHRIQASIVTLHHYSAHILHFSWLAIFNHEVVLKLDTVSSYLIWRPSYMLYIQIQSLSNKVDYHNTQII
jgi:hypothetical protein